MNLQIVDAKPLGHGIWIVRVAPEDISVLGRAPARLGARSILVASEVTASDDGATLSVPIREIHVLNQGTTTETIVIETGGKTPMIQQVNALVAVPAPEGKQIGNYLLEAIETSNHVRGAEKNSVATTAQEVARQGAAPKGRDGEFLDVLEQLPPALAQMGHKILDGVRKEEPSGSLLFYPTSKRFVETPDNFWTIKPQPRDRSFVITVRGEPDHFAPTEIELLPDRGSYSRFKLEVEDTSKVDEAVRIILSARRKH